MRKKALFVIAFFFIFTAYYACSDTIELKDGKIIVGEILQESDDGVVVSKAGGGLVYAISRDRIENIRPSTSDELWLEEKAIQQMTKPSTSEEVLSEEGVSGKEEERLEETKKYRLEQYEKEVLAAKKARGRIKIKFSQGRDRVVDTILNGKITVPLYVDTGASHVVISRKVAEDLGIEKINDLPTVAVRLADGSIETNYVAELDSVQVANSKVKDVATLISNKPPGPGVDGLLGMTFLRYFHVKLDSKENCLVLEKY